MGALASVDDLKATATGKVEELKSKARAGNPEMKAEELDADVAILAKPRQRAGTLKMMAEEPSAKAQAIGAAAGAGLLAVGLSGSLTTAAALAIVCAYGTTLENEFGSATKSLGSACAKVYDKTLDLQEEYELIQKAKSAIDTTVTVADNLNENYQITGKIDEKLKLSAAVDKVLANVDEFKATASSKADELKAKATGKN